MNKAWTKLAKQATNDEGSSDHEVLPRKRYNTSIISTPIADHFWLIKASKLRQIVQKWKAHSCATPKSTKVGSHHRRSLARSLPVISCMAVSTFNVHSDDDDDDGHDYEDHHHDVGGGGNGSGGGSYCDGGRESCIEEVRADIQVFNKRENQRRRLVGGHCAPRRTQSWPMCGRLSMPPWSCMSHAFVHSDSDNDKEQGLLGTLDDKEDVRRIRVIHRSLSPLSASLSRTSKHHPPTTPKGYLALYVGEERRRFLVRATMLNHPLFSILLEKSREEFGFNQRGPLNIPCEIEFFEHIMLLVECNDPSYRDTDHSTILLQFNSSKPGS